MDSYFKKDYFYTRSSMYIHQDTHTFVAIGKHGKINWT